MSCASCASKCRRDITTRIETGTTIIVGMGTCGIAAGARETMHAILRSWTSATSTRTWPPWAASACARSEPLVDIEQAGKPRITYGNVTPDMVARLIEEHLVKVATWSNEWVVGRLPETT